MHIFNVLFVKACSQIWKVEYALGHELDIISMMSQAVSHPFGGRLVSRHIQVYTVDTAIIGYPDKYHNYGTAVPNDAGFYMCKTHEASLYLHYGIAGWTEPDTGTKFSQSVLA